jgi:hypothetical protein
LELQFFLAFLLQNGVFILDCLLLRLDSLGGTAGLVDLLTSLRRQAEGNNTVYKAKE